MAVGTLDTFPKLLLHHAAVRGDRAGDPREGSRHLADLDLAAVRRRGARARLRPAAEGLQRGESPRAHRRQPAAALCGDVRRAVPGRHPGAALPGRGRRGDGLPDPERGDRARGRRGPGAGRQAARDPAAAARRSSTSTTTTRAACATTQQAELRSYDELLAAGSKMRTPASSTARSTRAAAPTSPACSTPRAPPASPRAWCYTHASLIDPARTAAEFEGLGDDDVMLAYLPMAWIGQNIFSYAQAFVAGYSINCPESAER